MRWPRPLRLKRSGGCTAHAIASLIPSPRSRDSCSERWLASEDQSLLELAEACEVPVRWSCRTGVCHNCESGLISGSVTYQPDPLDLPAEGNVLICCSRPRGDVVLDI